MKISVIVPVYNVAEYIEPCMRSILEQTFQDFELIVVDDCGQDESIPRAHKVVDGAASFPVVWLRHERNRGLSAARNTGMEVAQGEYVLFVDSDDYLSPNCLSRLYAKAQETGANVVSGAYQTFGEGVKPHVGGQLGGYVMAWNKLCRRSFLVDNHISFIEDLIHEDNPWNFELMVVNPKFACVSDITYYYRIRANSLQTHHDYQRHFTAYCRILQAYSDTIQRRQATNMLEYFESQKALYFSMTSEKGTREQLRRLYSLIRAIGPKPAFSKADAHYSMPQLIGYYWYKKFHKYHLC